MSEINKICRHPRLITKWKVNQGRALVACMSCGFGVEITGDNLDEHVLKAEFNLAAQKASIGQRIFPVNN